MAGSGYVDHFDDCDLPGGVVDGLRAELVGLTQTVWAAQSGTVLLDTVAALERLRSTLDAVVMPVVAEVDPPMRRRRRAGPRRRTSSPLSPVGTVVRVPGWSGWHGS